MEVAQERDPPGESGAGGGAGVFGIVKKACKISVRGANNKQIERTSE